MPPEVVTELDVARDIRDGKIDSPQRFGNKWLFAIRITGTGISFRPSLNEYVYRPPEFYLTADFLERCQGLPVIFDHPDKSILNTEEYRDRTIGSVMLPYLIEDEVWCIALIYDEDAAELMGTTHISTSPAVSFEQSQMKITRAPDGSRLLIEGEPRILDHIAVCTAGVWDKGGPPSGVDY
ncbi:DUF2213 domain-containing protein [Acidiphilium sp.]|uniref:DUF2213 domain-containing protein n=1 Tax=Acidiphilium sp. TaxID=527 RepID=UPI003D0042F4